ncbi:MAG TPA: hypothetical protein PKA13_03450 [Geminicoccaceae bacterium]|nr:hypothetical protein [Geminicoccus sp.]HMU48804.1 hypothetical protein [Geminicoccaceae bacterium]
MDAHQVEHEAACTALHREGRGARSDDAARSVGEQQRAAGADHLAGIEKVVDVGDREGIERQREPAEQEEHREQRRQRRIGYDRSTRDRQGHGGQDAAAVEAIGKPAQGILQAGTAEDRGGHQSRDGVGAEADLAGEHRSDGKQRRLARAHAHDAGESQGRDPEKPHQPEGTVGGRDRRGIVRQQDRHGCERNQHRDEDEQALACRIGDRQEEPATGEAAELDRYVDRERPSAAVIVGAVVEPALGNDVAGAEADSGDETHQKPQDRLGEQRLKQDRGGCRRHQRTEHPDMADTGDEPGRQQGADDEADEMARHHDAGDRRSELLFGTQRQQRALQPVAQHQDGDAEAQRPGRANDGEHESRPRLALRPSPPIARHGRGRRSAHAIAMPQPR